MHHLSWRVRTPSTLSFLHLIACGVVIGGCGQGAAPHPHPTLDVNAASHYLAVSEGGNVLLGATL